MTRAKKARQKRREAAAPAPPPVRSKGGARKANPKVLAGVAGLILAAVVPAAIVIALTHHNSSSTSNGTTTLPDASAAVKLFDGIPQHTNVLGSSSAPVTMVEYIDLQCPVCREFETTVMPSVISKYVRTGKLKVDARPIAFLGPDSEVARKAAVAAMIHDRFFEYAQLLYFNQGQENSGWVTNQLLANAFASIPGLNVDAEMAQRDSPAVSNAEATFDSQSKSDNVLGTPTVLVGKTGGKLTQVAPGGSPTFAQVSAAVSKALHQ